MHIKDWVQSYYFHPTTGQKTYKNDTTIEHLSYKEVIAVYSNYEKEIWDFLHEDAQAHNMIQIEFICAQANLMDICINNFDDLCYLLGCYAINRVYREILAESTNN